MAQTLPRVHTGDAGAEKRNPLFVNSMKKKNNPMSLSNENHETDKQTRTQSRYKRSDSYKEATVQSKVAASFQKQCVVRTRAALVYDVCANATCTDPFMRRGLWANSCMRTIRPFVGMPTRM